LYDGALASGDGFVFFQSYTVGLFDSVAVIVELSQRDHLRECAKPAFMIAVPVADHDMIDLSKAGILRRRVNSFRVPVAISGKTCIEQQRFRRGRNEQGRGPPFDIDPIDFEIKRLRGSSHRENQSKESECAFHGYYLYKDGNQYKKICCEMDSGESLARRI